MHLPCRLYIEQESGIEIVVEAYERHELIESFIWAFDVSVFLGRAWTLQEQVLSPRIMYFGASLRRGCCEHSEWDVALQGIIAHLEQTTQHQNLAGLWRPFSFDSFFGAHIKPIQRRIYCQQEVHTFMVLAGDEICRHPRPSCGIGPSS